MTTNKTIALAGVLASSLLLSGCIISVDGDGYKDNYSSWQKKEKQNREQIAKLEPGMVLTKVVDQLGEPDFSEALSRDDKSIRVLYYRTHREQEDGMTTKDECTPLVFVDGSLTGWGDAAYQQVL